MKQIIDACTATTGWSMTSPSAISQIQNSEYISGLNASSLLFKFDNADTVRTARKTFNISTTGYDEIVLHVFSFRNRKSLYTKATDFSYKVKLATGKEFYIPTYESFSHVTLSLAGISTITEITFTALTPGDDWLVVSDIEMVKDQIPRDTMIGIKEGIEKEITSIVGLGTSIGTITGLTGDTSVTITNPDWLDRYAAILIKDSTNSEIHHIQNRNENVFTFTTLYDGNALLHDYTNATVYIIFPVEYGRKVETDIVIPSITIWGIVPEEVLRGAKLENIVDTWQVGGTPTERKEGSIRMWHILIDCEARQDEILADILSKAVRKFLGKEIVWVNGKEHDVTETVPATSVDPTELGDIIPKIQYTASVEMKEELYDRVAIPITSHIVQTYEIA